MTTKEFQSTPVIANGRISPISDPAGGGFVFQSTPVIANGRILRTQWTNTNPERFQSTPVIANGRISDFPEPDAPSTACFNPRPLLLTGESSAIGARLRRLHGFNPRPLLLTGES